MTQIAIKLIIDSATEKMNLNAKQYYIIKKGDERRGTIYVKTTLDNNLYIIHQRIYDFNCDKYIWQPSNAKSSNEADLMIEKLMENDKDCWVFDIDDSHNPFADMDF